MPTFCRHNRFIERCPICGADSTPAPGSSGTGIPKTERASAPKPQRSRSTSSARMRVRREDRSEEDGYHSTLLPGLRASKDAQRLAQEVSFAHARLLALSSSPPDFYAQLLAEGDLERSTWACFLAAYLSPLGDDDPFAGIRRALTADWHAGEPPDLADIPLGPRTSHDPARGAQTLLAYRQWSERHGSAHAGLQGEASWAPQRRFARAFERLALPGLARAARFDLFVVLGWLGLYEMRAGSLHLMGSTGAAEEPVALAAKRIFAIGDPTNLERRALAFAEAIEVPVEALDLALANWSAPERATLGFQPEISELPTLQRTLAALGL